MAAALRAHRGGAPGRELGQDPVPPLIEAVVSRVDTDGVFAVAGVHDPHNAFGPLQGDVTGITVGDKVLIAVVPDPGLNSSGVWLLARAT